MDSEFYFMAMGGLGVSLAGFAGLIAALESRQASESPVTKWRIRNVGVLGFSVTFVGFGTVALYTGTGESLSMTVRLASLAVTVPGLWWLWSQSQAGPAWQDERARRLAQAMMVALIAMGLANAIYGGLGALQFLLLWMLANPASIFLNTVRDLGRGERDEPPAAHER